MTTQISVGNGNVWQLSGELSFATANQILADFATQSSTNSLPQGLDLEAVTQVDSAGLALLIELKRQAKSIIFHNIPSKMLNLAVLSGVQAILSS